MKNILISKTVIALLAVFLCNHLQSQNSQVFTASGPWLAPACITTVTVQCWGGGGAGGSSTGFSNSAGGGGAGGAYIQKTLTIVPGNSYDVTVGVAQTTSGAAGNDSWFSSATTAIAKGGAGGANAASGANGAGGAGTTAGSIGDIVYAGGSGAIGNSSGTGGAGGGSAGAGGAGGSTTTGTAGAGGPTGGGAGGAGVGANLAGNTGQNPGGGGSGGSTTGIGAAQNGGAGANGVVIVMWPSSPVSVNSPFICSGQSATLNANGATSYTWTPGGATGASITVTPTSTTSYTVTGTSTNCSGTALATVTVYSDVQVNASTICVGGTAKLTASGAASYVWSPGGATTSSINVSPTSTTSYTVRGTSCGVNSTAVSTVTVNNCQTVSFTTAGAATWTAPACVSSVIAEVWGAGGGGGGGGGSGNGTYGGSGGGGGGYSKSAAIPVVSGTVYNIMVGAGGAAGTGTGSDAATTNAGGDGGDSWFKNNTTVLAKGGKGGAGGTAITIGLGGAAGSGIGALTFSGGNGGSAYNQDVFSSGAGGGSSAGTTANGNKGTDAGSNIATAAGGAAPTGGGTGGAGGGTGGNIIDAAGAAGTKPGGGGGGGGDDVTLGTGAGGGDGQVMITFTIASPVVTVNNGAICSGSSATLTASGATNYTWTPATGLSATNVASVTANPSSTTTYTVTGTSTGCNATATATSLVTVGGSIPVTVNAGQVCPSQSTILTASGADTYTWSPATGLSATTGASVTASPTSPTTYTVVGDISGCKGTATSNVTISPAPTITASNATICSGSTASLTAGGGVSYVWQAGGATSNPFVTPALTANTNYTVTGTDAQGCKATAVSSVTMAPGLTITVNNSTICSGLTTTLTAAGAATAGGPGTYTWQPGGFVGNPFTTPALSASTTYTVTGTDIGGCTGSAIANVTIASGLTITVSGNSGICPGSSNTLTAAGATNYTWSPATFLDVTTGATVTSTPSVTTTYTVVGDANGCTGTTTSAVSVTPLDDASFSYQSAGFCAPATAIATKNSPPIPAGTGTFSMTPTNELTLNTTTGDITVPAGATVGPYVVTLMTAGACPNSYSLTINVVANPDATFSYPLPNYCKNGIPNPTITQPAGSTPGAFSATPAGMVFVAGTPAGRIDLTASAPGNYTVTNNIVAGGGCPATSASNNVVIDPTPTVTASSTTVCAGTSGTINAGGATSYTWAGFPAGASLTDTPGATTPYTVTGTANGCSSTAIGTIYVDAIPVVGVIPPPAAVCPGQSATMTATGANSYTWVGASGAFPSTAALTDSPVATATYTVTGTIGICTGTATGTITVGSAPAIITADATICSGSTGATLTANGGIAYTWSPGGGNTSSINVNPTNTTTYTVTGTGPTAGCDGVAYATVVVNTTPSSSVAVAPGTICVGQSSTLTASPAGAASYTWSSGGTGNPLTVSPGVTTPYTVTVTTVDNCSATASGTVNVNPIPSVTVNDATICAGRTATLTAAGATTYAWSPNIGATASVSATPGADASFTVTGTAAGCSNTAVSNVKVNPLPVVTVNDASICAGSIATLTASGANTYSWLTGGALGSSINVNPTLSTPYTVVGTTLANCTAIAIANVTAYPGPIAAFDDPLTLNLSEANILFRNSSSNSIAWLWDFGDTATSIEESPQHQYADTGSYIIWLKVISNGGCTDSISHDITIVPDVLIFIPNAFTPSEDGLNDGFGFKSAGVGADGFEFRIFDRWGEQLFYTNDLMEEWKGDNKGVACPQDVYVYQVIIKDNFGKEKKYLGWVTLVR